MGLVVLDMSRSLDGFVAGPNVGLERPIGGERLHDWMYAGRTDEEARTVEEATFTFVAEGTHRALELATAAAGDRDVTVMGGAGLAQQFLGAGLLDELRLHLVPVLLGDGARLFEGHGGGRVELEPPA